ncbi:hypothetical protein FIV42_13980 [Persicimonas caeni]|uniref:VWA domain-containing protein n=1 Tax=Persicimonas caeni TaxID=2292766 RepID=A0A4Y6PU86_PERCE|nr:hypothetical protein [Persicimonas caeni]QDG51810.1 hypothetical protein FIV42_13980 [Persicimonas caeni]QED33031.1 hypothetical protein FRD00_13975 [Persicimonas caeni]
MFVWKQPTRLAAVALCAGLTMNCGACEDTSGGDLIENNALPDGGELSDGSPDGDDDDRFGGDFYDPETGVGQLVSETIQPKMDILWVIDNSTSMCEEQAALRQNFSRFANQLVAEGVDFNLGITTTHMRENFPVETVAKPGELQSTPQPIPNYIPTCHGDVGDPDDPNDGYAYIRDRIETAVGCAKDPSAWQDLLDITDEEIACHLNRECGGPEDLFPKADEDGESPYRETPKVVRSSYYDAANKVDVERMSRDFACMSLVGTRGFPIEKGLGAAVKAVSPEMTGGAAESPTDDSAPNHGLVRQDAEFALVFVTDENDCTHDGTLPEDSICAGSICEFANRPDDTDSPLIDPTELAAQFANNLSATKGREIDETEVTVASIHGRWKRYGATDAYPEATPIDVDECSEMEDRPGLDRSVQPACDSEFGTAFSGDRYERFARNFSRSYPQVDGEHMPGLICQPDAIPDTLEAIGSASASAAAVCITRELHACEGDATACPDHRFGDAAPSCAPGPNDRPFCDSAVELQLFAGIPGATLTDTGYCIPDSIDADGLDGGCVVSRDKYRLATCNSAEGVRFVWENPQEAVTTLDGYYVKLRYLTDAYGE